MARARDVGGNEGIGASASTRRVNSAVGFAGTSRKLDHRALGISYEAARELGGQIDSLWERYAERIHFCADGTPATRAEPPRLSAAQISNDGEAPGLVDTRPTSRSVPTRLRIVDLDRFEP